MASVAQVNYAKSLLARDDRSTSLYPISEATPSKAASWLIDKLKSGEDFSPSDYEEVIGQTGPKVDPTQSAVNQCAKYGPAIFDPILRGIQDPDLNKFLSAMIKEIPDYFWYISASSTDKYHPDCSRGNGGLVRHTILDIQIWCEFINNAVYRSLMPEKGPEMGIVALTLHDMAKDGFDGSKYTVFEHPLLPGRIYRGKIEESLDISAESKSMIDELIRAIDCHMGPWNKDRYSAKTLPTPKTEFEKLIHMADYLASRKYVTLSAESIRKFKLDAVSDMPANNLGF